MRTLIILVFCGFWGYTMAQNGQPEIKLVYAAMKQQEESWNKGDIRSFMSHYWQNDSLKFIGSRGITYGWQKTLDNYLKSYPTKEAMGKLQFTIAEAQLFNPETIFVIGKWHLEKDKPVGGYFTLLWKKVNNKWVIVTDHTS